MLEFIKGACRVFIMICNIEIPISQGYSIKVYVFFVAVLGITLAVKFIRGLFL